MNLHMYGPKNEVEDVFHSITKNCETLIEQTHMKPQEMFQVRHTQPKETFSIKVSNSVGLDSKWIIGLSSLEVYSAIFISTEEKNKFELYTNLFDEFSFTKKMSVRRSLIFQKFHPNNYNRK